MSFLVTAVFLLVPTICKNYLIKRIMFIDQTNHVIIYNIIFVFITVK